MRHKKETYIIMIQKRDKLVSSKKKILINLILSAT